MAKFKVDFSGVDPEIRKGSGKGAHVPEGDYLVKITKGEMRTSERSGSRYFNWGLQVIKPIEFKGKVVYTNTSLKPEALWSLRNLIFAATGKNVAGKALSFDPDTLSGKIVAITVEDDERKDKDNNPKIYSNVVDVRPKDEYETEDEEESDDEEETEEETEEVETEEELEEVDLDEL